jgi:hypothetical protein
LYHDEPKRRGINYAESNFNFRKILFGSLILIRERESNKNLKKSCLIKIRNGKRFIERNLKEEFIMSKEQEEKDNLSLEQEEKKESNQEIDPQKDPDKPKHPED